ncbi:Vacuolar protein sorting-associated protein 70 [Coemansia biformis]|uniref:Vacuolar protein sorting-associated protein 70 n=1 Tax=Coemansia biformis TaxID=1286918 RepID=A0A9W7YDW9_9FUNG|nr:Vacuolar protein sorting-associated protein 70 [Coemansia biformis]
MGKASDTGCSAGSGGTWQQRRCECRRRAAQVLLAAVALAFVLAVYLRGPAATAGAGGLDPARVLMDILSAEQLRENLEYYASGAHVAGTNTTQADHTRSHFERQGIGTETVEYYPWLNYPVAQRVALFNASTGAVSFEAGLQEARVPGDPASDDPHNLPAFHGHSADGNVTGRLVYANYGTGSDFRALGEAGVSVKGAIVLMRYGVVPCAYKVHAAELAGAHGALVYSDPIDDGYGKGRVYPAGPWRPASSLQRDSVLRLDVYPGDPLTPGYPSTRDAPRLDPRDAASLNRIPSLPISHMDALPLLVALQGHGVEAADISRGWVGGLTSKGVRYWTGPSALAVNLLNQVAYRTVPIQNVIGRIKGWEDPEQVVVIGNHRDAWSAGASDPSSGSAVLLELARALGELGRLGWRPRRTIILASWDAGEYGLAGSTEWVEENIDWLRADGVAYVNVGAAVEGSSFRATASPALKDLLYAAAKQVAYPHSNGTVYDAWLRDSVAAGARGRRPAVQPLGPASDTMAFAVHAGVSAVDFGFAGSGGARHSNFDSIQRVAAFVDPDMQLHLAAARLWGQVAVRLADDPVLRLSPTRYAADLKRYIRQFERKMALLLRPPPKGPGLATERLGHLRAAQHQLEVSARIVEDSTRHLRLVYGEDCQMAGRRRHRTCLALRASINDRVSKLERHFIDPDGAPGREWHKHVLVAPDFGAASGYRLFPALADALDAGDALQLREREKYIAGMVHEAAWFLREA